MPRVYLERAVASLFFTCHFLSHKPHFRWAPGASEVETRPRRSSWEPLDPAEARGEQACPGTAAGQAGKEGFLGASVLRLERLGVRRQGETSGGKMHR